MCVLVLKKSWSLKKSFGLGLEKIVFGLVLRKKSLGLEKRPGYITAEIRAIANFQLNAPVKFDFEN